MKILVLNYEFPPLGGGASPVSHELAKRYVERGHQVDVVTMGFKQLPSFENRDGIRVFRVPCLRKRKEICQPHEMLSFVLSAIRFLSRHLKKNTYDCNHTHFAIPTGIVSMWCKRKFGLPYIITSHGSDIPGYNTDRFSFMHRFTRPLIRRIANNSQGNFAGSAYLRDLANNNVKPKKKFTIVKQGIDTKMYRPLNKKKIILSTGRLLERKGFHTLIKAVSQKDIGFEVHIGGDGPMMPTLRALARKSKTKIVFHGWLNNESKKYHDLIGQASIYCLVSEKENASVTLLEAMSAGCAMITSNVSGCPESVGEAGILVPPNNVVKLNQVITRLTENSELLESLSKKAQLRARNEYDWETITSQYLEKLKRCAHQ